VALYEMLYSRLLALDIAGSCNDDDEAACR
jgi:hypothetical protein